MVSTLVTQSRMASLVASLSVRVPLVTGRTCGTAGQVQQAQHANHAGTPALSAAWQVRGNQHDKPPQTSTYPPIHPASPHLGAQQAHAEHVERLALHVLLAHVHNALQARTRAHSGLQGKKREGGRRAG